MPANNMDMTHVVTGIDLGTTYSCIAQFNDATQKPDTYPNLDQVQMRPDIPSVVYIEENGNIIVGSVASRRYLVDPENGVAEIKRHMGDPNHLVLLRGQSHSPVEISSMILRHIKENVYSRCPEGQFAFDGVVVTHPLYFKASQISDTIEAGHLAGLPLSPNFPVAPEPVAAALAYALLYLEERLREDEPQDVLVFDLGGGTFDTTLFRLVRTQDALTFEVLAAEGDMRLGGGDFNRALIDYVLEKEGLKSQLQNAEERIRLRAEAALFEQADEVKRKLSTEKNWWFTVPHVNVIGNSHVNLNQQITQEIFEDILRGAYNGDNYVQRIREALSRTLSKAGRPTVRRVILVGGSSYIPLMSKLIQEIIPGAEIYRNLEPNLAIAEGAALFAAIKAQPQRYRYDREIRIIMRTVHALGVRTIGDKFEVIIPDSSTTPVMRSKWFQTPEDNTPELSIDVFQGPRGSRKVTDEGIELIGTILLPDLPPHRRGDLHFRITFTASQRQTIQVKIELCRKAERLGERTEELRMVSKRS